MTRGRRPASIPREAKKLYLRVDLMAKVDLILQDPLRQKIRYGSWSTLVEELLQHWIDQHKETRHEVPQETSSD